MFIRITFIYKYIIIVLLYGNMKLCRSRIHYESTFVSNLSTIKNRLFALNISFCNIRFHQMCFITSLYKLQSGTIQLQGVSVYFFEQIF